MSYDSPLLPIQEILECFRESNINVNESDMKNPDPRRWHDIYAQIFEALTGKPIEQVIQALFRVERMQTDHHDLFEEGYAQMAFTRCLQTVLCRFGFTSFSIKDVIQPAPRRVHRLASIFFNALRHIQVRRLESQNIITALQTSRGQFESVLNHNKKLKELLAGARETQPMRDAMFQALQQEFEQHQQTCFELNKIQEEERRTVDELKFRVAEVDAQRENQKQHLATVRHEVEKMSQKIVQSPKRFKEDSKRYKITVDEKMVALASQEQSLSENRILIEQTEHKIIAAEKAVKLIKEVQIDQDKENDIVAAMQKLIEGQHEQKELYQSYCLQEEGFTEQLRVRQEQGRTISSQMNMREQSTHQQLTDLRRHQETLMEKSNKLETEVSQFEAKSAPCSKELAELEKVVEEIKHEFDREVVTFMKELVTQHDIITQESEAIILG